MSDNENENDIVRVLLAAGARVQPPADLQESVRAATYAEWHAVVASRATRRRIMWALAAGLVFAIVGLVTSHRIFVPRGQELVSGDRFLALDYPGGVSVRLDRNTRIMRGDDEHITLLSGAVYVDAGRAPHTDHPLQIQTPAGAVSHLGTQYEVRLLSVGTRIRVREGRVQLNGNRALVVNAREQWIISRDGTASRATIAADSEEWAWTANAAPAFEIEGHSLHDFLAWAGRELGCKVVYATPEAEAEAARAILSGSTAGFTPDEALAAVLPTTSLRYSKRAGKILIDVQR